MRGGQTGGLLDARNSETEKHKETLFIKRKEEADETSYADATGLKQWENGARMSRGGATSTASFLGVCHSGVCIPPSSDTICFLSGPLGRCYRERN